MKKHGQEKQRGVTLAELHRVSDVPVRTLQTWESEGMPTDSKQDAMRWWIAHKPDYFKIEGSGDKEQWTTADWKKWKTRFDALKAQHEYEKETDKYHDKEKCGAKLTAVFAEESRHLHLLGGRIAAQFPEMGSKLRDAIDRETDTMLERLKNG